MGPIDFLVENIMIPFLKFSYTNIFANYAIGIVLLTIVIKLILYPLTHKQFVSMKQMQALQPEFKALKEKHKKNPQKLQQEMNEKQTVGMVILLFLFITTATF